MRRVPLSLCGVPSALLPVGGAFPLVVHPSTLLEVLSPHSLFGDAPPILHLHGDSFSKNRLSTSPEAARTSLKGFFCESLRIVVIEFVAERVAKCTDIQGRRRKQMAGKTLPYEHQHVELRMMFFRNRETER